MTRLIFFVLAIILISISCGSCKQKSERNKGGTTNEVKEITINNRTVDCYADTLKWIINDSTYLDTILFYKNIRNHDSTLRICCSLDSIDPVSESLILNNEDVQVIIERYRHINSFLIISFEKQTAEIIVHISVVNIQNSEAIEIRRYQIINNKIVGINPLPGITKEFRPYDEFKKWRPVEL